MTNFKVQIICDGCWAIGDGYGFDANFIAIIGKKKKGFGFINEELDYLPLSGTYDAKEVLEWATIPGFVKEWIKKQGLKI